MSGQPALSQLCGHHLQNRLSMSAVCNRACTSLLVTHHSIEFSCHHQRHTHTKYCCSPSAFAGAYAKMVPRRMLNTCTGWSASYGQCGGVTCPDGGSQCSDTAYNCCPTDFSCQRQNEWYWQCLPGASSPPVVQAAPATPASTASPAPPPSSRSSSFMSLFKHHA